MTFSADQIRGCLVGGAIGDALGSAYEGQSGPLPIDWDRPWRLTDDTQLTLATCEAIIDGGRVNPASIALQMATWFRQRRVSGLGASTFKALQELADGGHWALVGRKGEFAAGNGAAARIAPLAFLLDPESESDRQLVRDVCRITHHNDEAYAGALAVLSAVQRAAGGELGNTAFVRRVANVLPDTRVRDRLLVFADLPPTSLQEVSLKWGCSGYVVESIPLALYAAHLIQSIGFQSTLEQVVSVGGDTDTIAAIAGQVMGAFCGYDMLPEPLKDRLPDCETIEQLSAHFESVCLKGTE